MENGKRKKEILHVKVNMEIFIFFVKARVGTNKECECYVISLRIWLCSRWFWKNQTQHALKTKQNDVKLLVHLIILQFVCGGIWKYVRNSSPYIRRVLYFWFFYTFIDNFIPIFVLFTNKSLLFTCIILRAHVFLISKVNYMKFMKKLFMCMSHVSRPSHHFKRITLTWRETFIRYILN